jgi:hypothetical protein
MDNDRLFKTLMSVMFAAITILTGIGAYLDGRRLIRKLNEREEQKQKKAQAENEKHS